MMIDQLERILNNAIVAWDIMVDKLGRIFDEVVVA
jgi:hypothetical protein